MSLPAVRMENMSEAVRANLARQHDFFAGSAGKVEAKGVVEDEKKAVKKSRKKHTLTPDEASNLVRSVKVSEDGNEVKLILAINPATIPTAQGKGAFVDKGGHVHFFTKPAQRKAEKAFEVALSPYAHLSRSWGEVPVAVQLDLYFEYPSGTPKKHLHKIGPHTQRPDGDNCAKGELDAMTKAGYWPDDSYINTLIIRKRRTTGPACIVIKIKNLQPLFDALYLDTEAYENPTLFSTPSMGKPEETNPLSDLNQSKE